MSELDDAIREHLELKRRHGARDDEVKRLEDEAFGSGQRPVDPFHAADDLLKGGEEDPEPAGESAPSMPPEEGTPADVPPPETPPPVSSDDSPEPTTPDDSAPADEPAEADDPPPSPDEPSAGSNPIPPPPPRADRASEVVHMPTEEHHGPDSASEEISADAEFAEFEDPPAVPADAEPLPATGEGGGGDAGLYDFEADAPAEPAPASLPPADFGEVDAGDEDAFAELGPADQEPSPPAEDVGEEGEEDGPGPGAVAADTSEREALEATQRYRVPEAEPAEPEDSLPAEEPDPTVERPAAPAPPPADAPAAEDAPEDLLEETPEFLEGAESEDEDLWFEQRPPKDFDFDE